MLGKLSAHRWLSNTGNASRGLHFHIETYGCQMNVNDSEIVRSILMKEGHVSASTAETADLILTNTCAIRENAELRVFNRLQYFQSIRKKNRVDLKTKGYPIVGVLGCMAERLKDRLLEKDSVDFICGPDAYRDIPRLLQKALTTSTDQKHANTQLSLEETYADVAPVRETNSSHSAFVSIMRGCNNMCSFCIVPFTRGRERSRDMATILSEVRALVDTGVREVVLLGQNVNGYHDVSPSSAALFPDTPAAADLVTPGFSNLYNSRRRTSPGARFEDLLEQVASLHPELRVRFTSPHPKDFPAPVLELIGTTPNLCKALHLPAQSGSSSVLKRMRRGYSREAFLDLVARTRELIPGVSLSTDIISGFCGETEEEHQDTLRLLEEVQFDQAFMYAYSLRDRTHAAHTMEDDVPEETKQRRLAEVIQVFRQGVQERNEREELGRLRLVLVEGPSTKSTPEAPTLTGRTDGNKRCIFSAVPLQRVSGETEVPREGEYVLVRIVKVAHTTLKAELVSFSSIAEEQVRLRGSSSIHTQLLVDETTTKKEAEAAQRLVSSSS